MPTLKCVVIHYEVALGFQLTCQEREDLVAFLEALQALRGTVYAKPLFFTVSEHISLPEYFLCDVIRQGSTDGSYK